MPHEELYLCAILARNEPTFVICVKMDILDEEAWITTLGGWRVFPYWHCELAFIMERGEYNMTIAPPEDCPDSVWKDGKDDASALVAKYEGQSILQKIGLAQPPIKRRI